MLEKKILYVKVADVYSVGKKGEQRRSAYGNTGQYVGHKKKIVGKRGSHSSSKKTSCSESILI